MTTKEKILALIKLEPGLKQADVAKKLGLSDSVVYHHLHKSLIPLGMVRVKVIRKKGEWIIKQPYVTNTKILEYTGPE